MFLCTGSMLLCAVWWHGGLVIALLLLYWLVYIVYIFFPPVQLYQKDVLLWIPVKCSGWKEEEDKAKTIRHTFFSSCRSVHRSCISALTHLDAAPTTNLSVQIPSVTDSLPPAMPLRVVKSWCSFIFSHTTGHIQYFHTLCTIQRDTLRLAYS